jgi:hypothetical protein
MTVITFGGDESWHSPRWAFARLARATSLFVTVTADLELLEDAVARDFLTFSQLDGDSACRLARALRQGASWLREELLSGSSGDPHDQELADALVPLATQLGYLLDAQGAGRFARRPAAAVPAGGSRGRR